MDQEPREKPPVFIEVIPPPEGEHDCLEVKVNIKHRRDYQYEKQKLSKIKFDLKKCIFGYKATGGIFEKSDLSEPGFKVFLKKNGPRPELPFPEEISVEIFGGKVTGQLPKSPNRQSFLNKEKISGESFDPKENIYELSFPDKQIMEWVTFHEISGFIKPDNSNEKKEPESINFYVWHCQSNHIRIKRGRNQIWDFITLLVMSFIVTIFLFPNLAELAAKLIDYLDFTQPNSDKFRSLSLMISVCSAFGLLYFLFYIGPESRLKKEIAKCLKSVYKGEYLCQEEIKIPKKFMNKLREEGVLEIRFSVSIEDSEINENRSLVSSPEVIFLDENNSYKYTISIPDLNNYPKPWDHKTLLYELNSLLREKFSYDALKSHVLIEFENFDLSNINGIENLLEENLEEDCEDSSRVEIDDDEFCIVFKDSCKLNNLILPEKIEELLHKRQIEESQKTTQESEGQETEWFKHNVVYTVNTAQDGLKVEKVIPLDNNQPLAETGDFPQNGSSLLNDQNQDLHIDS